MLDDYNYLDQFKIPFCLNLYKKLLTKVPARELKQKKTKSKRVIFVANYHYLPFIFAKQILINNGIDCQIVVADDVKSTTTDLVISNFSAKKDWQKIKNRADEPQFIADIVAILDIFKLTDQYNVTKGLFIENRELLRKMVNQNQWYFESNILENLPKQISIYCLGKNLLFFSSNQFSPVAMAFNYYSQNLAKNVAFNQNIEDLAHQLAPGWTSHPIDKQWAVFDTVSKLDSKQNRQYFAYKSRFLSGMMPASKIHFLKGETENEQLWYGLILAQFSSLYLASLNKVNPLKNKILDKF